MKDDNSCQTCLIYWCAFPGLAPNSYDNLSNMNLDLNVSTRSVNFSANNQELLALVYKLG